MKKLLAMLASLGLMLSALGQTTPLVTDSSLTLIQKQLLSLSVLTGVAEFAPAATDSYNDLLYKMASALSYLSTNYTSGTGSVSFPITLAQGGLGSTNAASARASLGLSAGEPGSLGTNAVTWQDYATARTNLLLSGRMQSQRLTQTPLLSIPQRAVVANLPVDQPSYWYAASGTTVSAATETEGSSLETRVLSTNLFQHLKLTPSGAVTQMETRFTNATPQDWSGCHFLIHGYIEDATDGTSLTSTNFTGVDLTLYDASGNYGTVSMGSHGGGEGTTNGAYYTGSVPMWSGTNAINWAFSATTFDRTQIKRVAIKPNFNVASIATPFHIGSFTVARPPARAGRLCIIFDQTKSNGQLFKNILNWYGMKATWAVQTNTSYQTWSDWELRRMIEEGHGVVLYSNDTIDATDLADWIATRVRPTQEWALERGLGDLQFYVYGGSGAAPFALRHAHSVREYLRPLIGSPIYSSHTKVSSPYWLWNIVRYQEWTSTAQYPTTVTSGNIANGTIYYVKSGGSVSYNGDTYALGASFKGVTGITNYTGSGAVCARSTWQGYYEEASKTGGMCSILLHAHSRSASDIALFKQWLDEIVAPDVLAGNIEVVSLPQLALEAAAGWPRVPGNNVSNTSDVSDTATQLNALLAELRRLGVLRQ